MPHALGAQYSAESRSDLRRQDQPGWTSGLVRTRAVTSDSLIPGDQMGVATDLDPTCSWSGPRACRSGSARLSAAVAHPLPQSLPGLCRRAVRSHGIVPTGEQSLPVEKAPCWLTSQVPFKDKTIRGGRLQGGKSYDLSISAD
jgi:hypothetical protein